MQNFLVISQAANAQGGGNLFLSLLPMVAIFGLMYLLMIRPQKKEEKKMRERINALQVGDTVVTIGGIVGKVMNIANDEITIATSVANTMMTFKKQAISNVIKSEENLKTENKEQTVAEKPKKKGLFGKKKDDDVE